MRVIIQRYNNRAYVFMDRNAEDSEARKEIDKTIAAEKVKTSGTLVFENKDDLRNFLVKYNEERWGRNFLEFEYGLTRAAKEFGLELILGD